MMKKTKAVAKTKKIKNEVLLRELKNIVRTQKEVINELNDLKDKGKLRKSAPLLEQLEGMGMSSTTLGRFSNICHGQVFLWFKENWEEDDFPKSFKSNYPGGVYDYIYEKYGVEDQMADMYIKVWVAFFSGKHKVKVPSYVPLADTPIAKMNTAASYVIRGEMNKKRWQALANDSLTRSEMAHQMRFATPPDEDEEEKGVPGPKKKLVNEQTRTSLTKQTGDLRLFVKGTMEQVGFLNINSTSPLVLDEIRRICKMAKIKIVR